MTEILCYGDVGWTITARSLEWMIDDADDDVTLRIHSFGGDVSEGVAIYNVIRHARAKGKSVTAVVDGIAASAASYMALSADRMLMGVGADMYLHNPIGHVYGYARDLRSAADELDKCRDDIIDIYQRKTGRSVQDIANAMGAETRFTAKEAIAYGLADGMDDSDGAPDVGAIDRKWASITTGGQFTDFAADKSAMRDDLRRYAESSYRLRDLMEIGNPAWCDTSCIIQPTDDERAETGEAPADEAGEAPVRRVCVAGRIYEVPSNGE